MQSDTTDKKLRYAIYGGSFDPIHVGHMAVAEAAVNECGIDSLVFMPAYTSPFKLDRKVTSGRDRIAMIESILHYNEAFTVSDYELTKGGASYTVETLRHFRSILDGELCFVLGFDSTVQIDTWYEGAEILREYPLITVRRPDTDDKEGMAKIESYRRDYGSDITLLHMEPVDASSTLIRSRIAEGKPLEGLVAPEVEEYIIEHKLYK